MGDEITQDKKESKPVMRKDYFKEGQHVTAIVPLDGSKPKFVGNVQVVAPVPGWPQPFVNMYDFPMHSIEMEAEFEPMDGFSEAKMARWALLLFPHFDEMQKAAQPMVEKRAHRDIQNIITQQKRMALANPGPLPPGIAGPDGKIRRN